MRPTFDDRDQAILDDRIAALDVVDGHRVGDYVIFADGVTRRVSHVWDDGPQTSDGGSYYLGRGYVSFSGGLHGIVPNDTLTLTGEHRSGRCWFFHHDYATADNGVDVTIPFRVFTCTQEAPR